MRHDIEIKQGATFEAVFYWYDGDDQSMLIDDVTLGYPTILEIPAHGFAAGETPITILGARGCTAINSPSSKRRDRIYATKVSTDTVSIPVFTALAKPYTGQGYVVFTPAVDLTGWEARMTIRRRKTSADALVELTDADGIVLGDDGSIQVTIDAAVTEALSFTEGVYDLEVESPSGLIKRLVEGSVCFSKEVTRPDI